MYSSNMVALDRDSFLCESDVNERKTLQCSLVRGCDGKSVLPF